MSHIGRQIQVGFGKETTRGTAVSAGAWLSKTDFSVIDKSEHVMDEASIGSIVDSKGSHVVKKWSEGDFSGNVEINTFCYVLLGLFGSVSSTAASTGAYEHTFTLSNSNNIQSLTIAVKDPVDGDKSYPLSALNSLTINVEEGQFVTFTANFMGKGGESATHTATYAVDYQLLARHSAFKVAANLAGLDAEDATCFKSFEITLEKNIEADYCAGSITPRDFINKQFSISGSFTAIYEATTFKGYNLDGTTRAIRFEVVDSNTTIGATDNPTVSIDLPMVTFTEWDKSQGNDEVVTQTLTFKGHYSITDASAIEATIVNTVATI